MHLPVLPETLQKIIRHLHERGARCLLAGGGVIDHLLGLEVNDWDIEVYHLTYQQLSEALSRFAVPNLVGRAFGVIKCRAGKLELDFSLPRLDNRVGKGHRAFEIDIVPDLDTVEAARRRDITINSMYIDLATGELIDHFGGAADLAEGRIRATDPRTFPEDPLRVLRVMQMLPRKGKFVDPATIELCASIVDEFDTLPRERLFEEFKKLFLKTDSPSTGLRFLEDCTWITKFPELDALRGCPQNPQFHPEGDVWTHTLYVMDHAASMREHLPEEWRLAYMFGMLCHDIGKPSTTDPETFTAYGHENTGEELTRKFMSRLTENTDLVHKTCAIVAAHMRPYALHTSEAKEGAWKRLHNKVPLHVIAYVTQADSDGRQKERRAEKAPEFETCMRYAHAFGAETIRPVLMGRHLIDRGHAPGPAFSALLERAYQYQLDSGTEDIEEIYNHTLNENPPAGEPGPEEK